MNRQKRKNFGRIEHVIHCDQIVVGVLKANVSGAVVDRLDAAKVE
jgi:hypothetical protein